MHIHLHIYTHTYYLYKYVNMKGVPWGGGRRNVQTPNFSPAAQTTRGSRISPILGWVCGDIPEGEIDIVELAFRGSTVQRLHRTQLPLSYYSSLLHSWVGFENSIEINFYGLCKDCIGFLFH